VTTLLSFKLVINKHSVLHPSHKLSYFKTASWDDEWITAAEEIVREEFERAYEAIDSDEHEDEQEVCFS
jgi:hypothetical protein